MLFRSEALADIELAVNEDVASREADGFEVPVPLTERKYSGRFVVRTSPALHARVAIEAAEQNVSMNQWVVYKLAGPPDHQPVRPVTSHTISLFNNG